MVAHAHGEIPASVAKWLRSADETPAGWRRHRQLRRNLTPRLLRAVDKCASEPVRKFVWDLYRHPVWSFEPRPDDPASGDEQTGFIESDAFITVCCGGNGSGKTYCGAQKLVRFLQTNQPRSRDTPFWVIANSYEQSCNACWFQKLREMLPREWIDWKNVRWYSEKRGWPLSVPLRPVDGSGRNWLLEFKSYEQGREEMQATAIAGAWFSEQFPWDLFTEVLRGCREFAYPGAIWMEFTPIDPAKSLQMEQIYEDWLIGDPDYADWRFCFLNTETALAAGHVDPTWYRAFFASVSEEMAETRKRGVFASYEGTIYRHFNPAVHLVPDFAIPAGVYHRRAIDWGFTEEHAFCCLWGFLDAIGTWWIYDEYYSTDQTATIDDHLDAIAQRRPWPNSPYYRETFGDPSEPAHIRHAARRGMPIRPANNNVWDGIDAVRVALKDNGASGRRGLYINRDKCPNLARQMRTYRAMRSTETGVNPRDAKPMPLKKNDHAVDALRYLVFSAKTAAGTTPEALRRERPERIAVRHRRHPWQVSGELEPELAKEVDTQKRHRHSR